MIKNFMDFGLKLLLAKFDESVNANEVREYVMEHYARLTRSGMAGEALDQELTRLEQLLLQLGWIKSGARREISEEIREKGDWQGYNWLAEDACFSKDGLEPGCGQFLDWMEASTEQENGQLVSDNLENLLRHVEVKREKSLRKFTREITDGQKILERCDISILFSRTARRRHDLRFLNAALKMNEWFMRELKHASNDVCMSRLLIALAEGEISARELLA